MNNRQSASPKYTSSRGISTINMQMIYLRGRVFNAMGGAWTTGGTRGAWTTRGTRGAWTTGRRRGAWTTGGTGGAWTTGRMGGAWTTGRTGGWLSATAGRLGRG